MLDERFGRHGRRMSNVFLLAVWLLVLLSPAIPMVAIVSIFRQVFGGADLTLPLALLIIVVGFGVGLVIRIGFQAATANLAERKLNQLEKERQELLSIPGIPAENRERIQRIATFRTRPPGIKGWLWELFRLE